jgi:hypothetical protein
MNAPFLRILAIGVLLVGLLAGCATTVAQQNTVAVPNAENPEYLGYPLRALALGVNFAGNLLQYGVVEPLYLLFAAPIPDAVGLSLEERAYLGEREKAWQQYLAGERPAVR